MRIQGNLATYEFSDLLQWLAQGNKTGMLTVGDGKVEYKLGFDHGRIDMSSSSDPSQRLDSYLHDQGVIDEATLARAERLRDATKMMSGQVLVTLGAVNEPQLAQALRQKTEAILCELLTWDQGSFEFEGGERPDTPMVPISLEVTKLLLESMHRLDQQRGGPPREVEKPSASFVVTEHEPPVTTPQVSPPPQVSEGLALAEVMTPEPPAGVVAAAASEPLAELPDGELPPHYAAMAESPGAFRRVVPFALVVLFCLTAGGFYLANRQANASPVEKGSTTRPILFTQTSGPPPSRPKAVPVAAPEATLPEATVPLSSPTPPARVAAESPSNQAVRLRYEEQIAELRRELENARRLAAAAPVRAGSSPQVSEPVAPRAEVPARALDRPVVSQPSPTAAPQTLPTAPTAPAPEPLSPPSSAEPQPAAPALPEASDSADANAGADDAPPPAVVRPTLVSRPVPRYPTAAHRHGLEATVTVRVLIGTDGRVQEIERVGPKAGMGFDRAAEQAARESLWEPGLQNGMPASAWAELRFEFSLEE